MQTHRLSWWRTGQTVLTEVALPLALYALLRWAGVSEAWSLVGAGAVSVLTGSVQWLLRGRVGLLGVIILVGFVVGALVAFLTDDAVAVFMVDPVDNILVAAVALAMMATSRPFVAHVRRDLTPHPDDFDQRWRADARFRSAHRQASWIWVAGLLLLAGVWTCCVAWLPFDAAVGASRVTGLAGFVAMIGGSELLIRRQLVRRGARQ